MTFQNSGPVFNHNKINLANHISTIKKVAPANTSKSLPLSAPMIDRIHKTRPGCSACGKKVA
jgi:hypothetical protein